MCCPDAAAGGGPPLWDVLPARRYFGGALSQDGLDTVVGWPGGRGEGSDRGIGWRPAPESRVPGARTAQGRGRPAGAGAGGGARRPGAGAGQGDRWVRPGPPGAGGGTGGGGGGGGGGGAGA